MVSGVRGECFPSYKLVFTRFNPYYGDTCENYGAESKEHNTFNCVIEKARGNGKSIAKGRFYCGIRDFNVFRCNCKKKQMQKKIKKKNVRSPRCAHTLISKCHINYLHSEK